MIHISIRRYIARFKSLSYLPCATSCAYLKKCSAKMIYYNDYRLCLYRQMVFIEFPIHLFMNDHELRGLKMDQHPEMTKLAFFS